MAANAPTRYGQSDINTRQLMPGNPPPPVKGKSGGNETAGMVLSVIADMFAAKAGQKPTSVANMMQGKRDKKDRKERSDERRQSIQERIDAAALSQGAARDRATTANQRSITNAETAQKNRLELLQRGHELRGETSDDASEMASWGREAALDPQIMYGIPVDQFGGEPLPPPVGGAEGRNLEMDEFTNLRETLGL